MQSSPVAPSIEAVEPDAAEAALAAALARFSGSVTPSAYGLQFGAIAPLDPAQLASHGAICPLPDLGLLRVAGADATSFLQAQLTNDVASLAADEVRLTGYCTPKGRLLMTALNWRSNDTVALAIDRASAQALRKRLSMFILRAKARISDESPQWLAFGILGPAAAAVAQALALEVPAGALHASASAGAGVAPRELLRLPALQIDTVTIDRCMLWLSLDDSTALDALVRLTLTGSAADASGSDATRADAIAIGSTELWRWTDLRAGIARVFPATSERFVPQMVNFEAVGGVNFKKGCYPGQEIVARSQYLGKLKRRMFVARLADPGVAATLPDPGADVVAVESGEAVGLVVMAARSPGGAVDVAFEAPIASVETGVTVAGASVATTPLVSLPLPYELKR